MIRALIAICFALTACAAFENGAAGDGSATDKPGLGQHGGQCGGILGTACSLETDYCLYEPGQCVEVADAAGICTVKPEICTREYRPVCGCDGKTYSNACVAASAGASIAYNGQCKE